MIAPAANSRGGGMRPTMARNGDGARAQGGSLRAIAHGPRAWCTQAVDAHHARRWQVYVAGGYSVKLP